MAERNALNPKPVYSDWRKGPQKIGWCGENDQRIFTPEVQRQIQHINAKYKVNEAATTHNDSHQRFCPRPSDHIDDHIKSGSVTDNEMLTSMFIKNQVISDACKGLDSAIDSMMQVVRQSKSKIAKLVQVCKGITPDCPNGLTNACENMSSLQERLRDESERLETIKERVVDGMIRIHAATQLPKEWEQWRRARNSRE